MAIFDKDKRDEQGDDDDLLQEINKGAKDLGGERYPLLYTDGVSEGFAVIRRFTRFKKRLGKVVTFAGELMVVETNNPEVKPGAVRSILEGTDKEAWHLRVARILMAAMGASKEDIEKEGNVLLAQAYGADQPLTNIIVGFQNVEARDKDGEVKRDKDGNAYVNAQFRKCNAADWARLSKLVPTIDPTWKPSAIQPGAAG